MLYRLPSLITVAAFAAAFLQAQTPAISAGGIINAASFDTTAPIAPGSLVAIFGTNLAPGLAQADSVPLSSSLSSVSVSFNGVAAPLDFVSTGQINAQVPYETGNGAANVVVTRNGVPSAPQQVVVNTVSPGVFAASGHAIAIIATDPNDPRYGTLAAPTGSIPGLQTFPAKVNDILIVYATGLGAVTPAVQNGHDSLDQLRTTVLTPTPLIGSVPATLYFSGLTPQYPGVYQLNVGVPQVAAGNAVPLQVQISGLTSPASAATIAISGS